MPFLTIIVPVYNKVKYIDSCIKSIIDQSFKDFELILINDGSTDKSGERCDHYANVDERILVLHQENQGVSVARNNGLKMAKGKYIGFIDSDDTVEKRMFEQLISNANKIDAEISICSLRIVEANADVTEQKGKISTVIFSKQETLKALLDGRINWSANNKIYKSEIARRVLFEGRMNEDLWYCFKVISEMDGQSIFINDEVYNYIKRENSVSLTGFNSTQMESITVSGRIKDEVYLKFPALADDAKFLDFVSNLSLLNLIILAKKTKSVEYNIVAKNLTDYSDFVKTSNQLNKKQKYAYALFDLSPLLYKVLLKTYCKIFPSEAGKKTL